MMSRIWRWSVTAGSAAAAAGAVNAAINAALLRQPTKHSNPSIPRVSVLLPLRNEAGRVEPCLRALLEQASIRVGAAELVVLDDGSTDGTADLVRRICGGAAHVRILAGRNLPDGWLGKPHACQQLADAASPDSIVLVFIDADVILAPGGLARTVDLLDRYGLDLASPYPRQEAITVSERLVQPLLQWSWLTFLPLRWAERSRRPSSAAANGQLLAVRRATYDRAGGHAAIRGEVLDDVALLRAVKRVGGRGGVADGTTIATCRMYRSWSELSAGYAKSLWSAFGSPPGAAGVITLLTGSYVVPVIAAARGSKIGFAGYAAGVAGRLIAARRTGGRSWPDALTHPLSIMTLGWLTGRSVVRSRAGALSWRGRPVRVDSPEGSLRR